MSKQMLRLALLATLLALVACASKVRLKDVTSITLYSGEYTTARRAAAVPQLKCVGGSAKGKFEPKVVQCYNRGFDGNDVQWECKAEIPEDYEFGKIQVSCEGYDYPEDPYILKGSCGLEYQLEHSSGASHHGSTHSEKKHHEESSLGTWVTFTIVCFVIYLIYCGMTSPREGHEGDRNRGGSGGPPPFPPRGPGPDNVPPPPGFKTNFDAPPPTYDEACNRGATHRSGTRPAAGDSQASSSSGPGFFTGLGLGGLAGYAFGRSRDSDSSYFRQRGASQYERDTGFFHDQPSTSSSFHRSSPTRSSDKTRTTSGFGGTVRR